MTGPETHRSNAREARRNARARQGQAKLPYIRRRIPAVELLSSEACEIIEQNAELLLEEIGIEFRRDAPSLTLWRDAGADVKGERVRIPRGLCRQLLRTAPREFTLSARNPARSVEIGSNRVVLSPAYGSPFVHDLENGRRYATLNDFQNFVKLAYSSPWLHHSGGTVCEPVDVPVSKRHLDMVYSHLKYSDKPFMGSVTAQVRAEDSIEMARIAFGADVVENNCVILGNVNVNSPLVWDATMTGALKTYARANQAPVVVPFILGGAMGPVTNAGAIAQSHAETMVGVALGQLVHLVVHGLEFGQRLGDEVVMLHGRERQVEPGHPSDPSCPQSRGVDHVLGLDGALLGVEPPVAVRQRRECKDAVAQDDLGTALACGDGEGVGRAVRIDGALVRVEETAEQPVGAHDRTLGDDLLRRREAGVNAERLVDGALAAQPLPALGTRRDRIAAGHVHADALAALRLDLLVERDRVGLQRGDVRIVVDRVETRGGVPGGAGGEFGALDQRDIAPAFSGEVVEHARADDASADDHDPIMRLHHSSSILSGSTARRRAMKSCSASSMAGSRPGSS